MSQSATHSPPSESDPLPDFAPYLFNAEDRHFWFRSRNTVIGRVAAQLLAGLPPGYRVLEVGCGNGNVLRVLEQVCLGGKLIGLDLSEEKLTFARRRTNCELRHGDLHRLAEAATFDLIGMFDVLEHLPDDVGALQAMRAALSTGGRLLLTVPAHHSLWSYADTHAGHYRRYGVSQLRTVLAESGLHVEYCTQFMAILFPMMWLGRRLASWQWKQEDGPKGDRDRFRRELRVVPVVNGLLTRLLECEVPLLSRRWNLPLGTSLLAIARKCPAQPILPVESPPHCRRFGE
jgi:SAM-dependent methyltransferase